MSFNKLLAEVKEAGEDMEWFPTTQPIIKAVSDNIIQANYRDSIKILDVGAGNGNVLKQLDELSPTDENGKKKRYFKKYAIEQSPILLNSLDSDIFVVGTDFHQQTFIDKKMNVIFCNPPYSEFTEWAIKLIEESNCEELFLVIPDRWKDNDKILEAIKTRKAEYNVIGNYSFLDSEFRKARATVDLVKITIGKHYNNRMYEGSDPFNVWFNKTFKIDTEKKETSSHEKAKSKREEIKNQLTDKSKVVENLVKFYTEDLEKLMNNYKALEKLDSSLMQELNINLTGLIEGLKLKISGLKNLYWKELFDNLEAITDRLTSSSREKLLNTLTSNTSVDFTLSNIYAVVIWAIKNSNKYIDSQLLDFYDTLTAPKNIQGYKSNKHMVNDTWRYLDPWKFRRDKSQLKGYKLDYRCVIEGSYGVATEYIGRDENRNNIYKNTVTNNAHTLIQDLATIAKNLGFNMINDSQTREWEAGKKQEFFLDSGELFVEIKSFLNGNIHYKLDQNFMRKLNVEASRLHGWIKSPQEASDELEISLDQAMAYFKSNNLLSASNIKLLN